MNIPFRDLEEIDCSNITGFSTYGFRFSDCQELHTVIYDPEKVTTVEGDTFVNCPKLKMDVYFPNNTSSAVASAFSNSGIERILNTGPGTKLSGGPYTWTNFRNMPNLKYVNIPATVTGESNLLNGGSDGGSLFQNDPSLECIIFNCPNVFTIGTSNHFNNGTQNSPFKIYVPDNLVSSYKADTYWSAFSSRIFGISQLETDNPTYYELWQNYN